MGCRMRLGSQYQRVYAVFLALQGNTSYLEPRSDNGLTISPLNWVRLVRQGLKVTFGVSFEEFYQRITVVLFPSSRLSEEWNTTLLTLLATLEDAEVADEHVRLWQSDGA